MIPAGQPPPGIGPNFIDPQTLTPTIVAISIIMMRWAISFVILRLYANAHAQRDLRIDDCNTRFFLYDYPDNQYL